MPITGLSLLQVGNDATASWTWHGASGLEVQINLYENGVLTNDQPDVQLDAGSYGFNGDGFTENEHIELELVVPGYLPMKTNRINWTA